jgi:hypothetical protein
MEENYLSRHRLNRNQISKVLRALSTASDDQVYEKCKIENR